MRAYSEVPNSTNRRLPIRFRQQYGKKPQIDHVAGRGNEENFLFFVYYPAASRPDRYAVADPQG